MVRGKKGDRIGNYSLLPRILAWNPPFTLKSRACPPRTTTMPALTEKGLVTIGVSKGLILPLRCPNCGIFTPGAEARAMIRAGQKVRCQCNDNLTAIAWAAMEGR